MAIETITIVPYYYVTSESGKAYEAQMAEKFSCQASSWRGFHHESSGIDFDVFKEEYHKYLENLKGIKNFPYTGFCEADYKVWFGDSTTPVASQQCANAERLMDIQPNGDANFCVDFPDYIIGNVRNSTIREIWNSEKAETFREYRMKNRLPVCLRCGSKYMAEIEDKV